LSGLPNCRFNYLSDNFPMIPSPGLEYFQPEGVFSWRRWLPTRLLLPTGKSGSADSQTPTLHLHPLMDSHKSLSETSNAGSADLDKIGGHG
jgi:hypothetical protein